MFSAPGGVALSWRLTRAEVDLLKYGIEPDDETARRLVPVPGKKVSDIRSQNTPKLVHLAEWWRSAGP